MNFLLLLTQQCIHKIQKYGKNNSLEDVERKFNNHLRASLLYLFIDRNASKMLSSKIKFILTYHHII